MTTYEQQVETVARALIEAQMARFRMDMDEAYPMARAALAALGIHPETADQFAKNANCSAPAPAPAISGGEWQPIETAPTDYTEVIGINAKGDVYRTWFFAPSSTTRDWLTSPGQRKWHPTHWMPLPAPPAIAAAGQKP